MTDTPASALPKNFDPAEIEARWYAHWENNGRFRPERPDAAPYTIVNPPPNVTGSLHIGHALDNTLQDVMIRYERLRGKDALWVVGTDHAGIATQMVVERQMALVQDKRTNYSREDFIAKVWEWKHESGGTITSQLRRLGCSMDWSREQFTMDPHFCTAVTKVFVDLYNKGLIYRDKRLVNWDPGLKTAISDLEVETREIQGKFWHFRYPLAADENGNPVTLDDGRDYIVVATTRPETMLADMAVAVNAADERYQSVIGKFIKLPITNRLIPIIADDHADPELGSGAVKITPGHDFNDFEVGRRAGIKAGDMLNMLDGDARVVQCGGIPEAFLGMYRFDARKAVVAEIDALGLLDAVEDRTIQTPYGDRSGVVIEPWLTDQWYVDAETLAKPAMEAVRTGAIEIVPKSWEKTYFNWMENIQPWCVSRQLWWGHRIPAWYGDDGEIYVAADSDAAQALTGDGIVLRQDNDVLDTWFSSALWPFATLGWPDAELPPSPSGEGPGVGSVNTDSTQPIDPTPTPPLKERGLLEKHYPNDLLISGFDILFFWDARMAMQGIEFMGDVPWRKLYLHGLVRAADGQKMSKSKGNVVDPLGLIDQFGADALRFFMAAMESQGRDIKMDDKRVEGYRNFATKLWNAARFCQANGIGASTTLAAPDATLAVNKWIIGEVVETVAALDKALADLRFDAAANTIYHFVWDRFCDWYLELVKPVLSPAPFVSSEVETSSPLPFRGGAGGGPVDAESSLGETPPTPNPSRVREGDISETRAVAGWVLDQMLVMLHPFMPFITEELWHAMGDRECDLIIARWPEPGATVVQTTKEQIEWLIGLVKEVRGLRTEYNIPWSIELKLQIAEPDRKLEDLAFWDFPEMFRRLTKTNFFQSGSTDLPATLTEMVENKNVEFAHKGIAIQFVFAGRTYQLLVPDTVDLTAERARLTKAKAAAEKEAASLSGRLSNPAFLEKAKPEAVEKARADHAEKSAEAERLAAALARLG